MSDVYTKYQRLLFDRPHPRVLRVTMHNPERLNSADEIMHGELATIWQDIDKDPSVSATILTGHGKVFSAGGDFKMIDKIINDFPTRARNWKEARDIVYNVINCSKPIISAIRGPAVGAGLVCGLLADISIATKDARIIDGHTRLGVAAGDHAAIIWPLLCGMAKARYYLMTGDMLTGAEAERIGLISKAVPREEVLDEAMRVAQVMATGAQQAIRLTKRTLNSWVRQAAPIFDQSAAYEMLCFMAPDVVEGYTALREKRAPSFPSAS